jgi:CheY-like chemotaxis protein
VAHEINNPLTYLLLNLQRLRQSLDHIVPDPAQRARAAGLLDDALDGGERVRVVVRDLLAFARADASAQGPVDVGAVLESSLKLADNALRHRARVETDLAAVPPVKANAARLGQVFLNLLVNAAQSFEDDNDAVNRVRVRLRCGAGDLVVVEIEDNGCGIPDDALPHVFEPFFTTKPIGAGTGLGLPITRSILDALGGDLTLASEPGAGTTARVLLPAIRLTPEADTSAPPMPPAGTRRARVMLVDDEAALARAVATELARDHEVKVFTHSALARDELLRDPDYDAVVCDLIMPELSGMELYRQVCRRHPHYTDRFVFVTGGAFTRRAAEFVATTPAAVLLKPFDGKAVGAAIARRLAETTTPDVLA